MGLLIDRFDEMLEALAEEFPRVRVLDPRPVLSNELHPTADGFLAVASHVNDRLKDSS